MHVLGCLLALASAVVEERPPFGFSGMELYLTHSEARGLLGADLDGDGQRDFALIHPGRARIDLFLQKSAEQIARDRERPPRYDQVNQIHNDVRFAKESIPLDRRAFSLAAADFDGDGNIDLAVLPIPPTWPSGNGRRARGSARGRRSWRAAPSPIPSAPWPPAT